MDHGGNQVTQQGQASTLWVPPLEKGGKDMQFVVSDGWRVAFPGAAAGILVMHGVANPPHHPAVTEHIRKVEEAVRARFRGVEPGSLAALPVLQAYQAHYGKFRKNYHVRLQLESVVYKGKPLASNGALVEAMFAAEINNLFLTAGHDLNALVGPVTLAVSRGGEPYTGISGQERVLKAGDMMMHDEMGIISNVIYGPDHRTRLTPDTHEVLFTVYAPAGIEVSAVRQHLEEIAANVQLITPTAAVDALDVYSAL